MNVRGGTEQDPAGEEIPPGYYATISRADPGGALPEPPGPRARLVAKALGVAFMLVAAAYLVFAVTDLITDPHPPGLASSVQTGRYVAAVVVPGAFGLLGLTLLRHADDPPRRLMRRRSHRAGPAR